MSLCFLGICILAAQVTNGGNYKNNLPTTASSYDGVARDISKFYKDKQINIQGSGYIQLDTDTIVTLGGDNGIKTDKYKKSPTYNVGFRQFVPVSDNSYITFGASTQLGGKESHSPCRDGINREYYCGNLTAWSDFEANENENPYNMFINYTLKF